MRKLLFAALFIPAFCQAQFVLQGIATKSPSSGGGTPTFTLNGISQSPYAGRFFRTVPVNLNSNFDLTFNAYLGNMFNNGMAFIFWPSATAPTATNPPCVVSTDNIHNFGTGSINNNFVIEFDIRGSFCVSGQNTSYEPTTDVNHVSFWRNNSACNFANYYSTYSALGALNYYAYEPYRIRWTRSTNTLEVYYNNTLIKSNIIDLVGLLGTNVYWGFSAGCYCVTGGPVVNNLVLNGLVLASKLMNFDAVASGKNIDISWQTASESNSAEFVIEKSSDGTNFYKMRSIPAAGTSTAVLNYKGLDFDPHPGMNYYRLKMVDADGKFEYSEIKSVKILSKESQIALLGNPVKDLLRFQIRSGTNESGSIQICEPAGRMLFSQTLKSNTTSGLNEINVASLQTGSYLLIVNYGGRRDVKTFIKE